MISFLLKKWIRKSGKHLVIFLCQVLLQNCEQTAGRRFSKCWLWGNCLWCQRSFSDDGIFFGETAHWLDENIALIPDFVANCGMARVLLLNARRGRFDRLWHISRRFTYNWHVLEGFIQGKPGTTRISQRSLFKSLQNLIKDTCILMNKTYICSSKKEYK